MNDYDPTRRLEPGEPEPGLDWDDEEGSPKLLWGRVLALAGVLLLAFLIGRASAPDDSADEVTELREQLAAANDEIEQLEQRVKFGATESPAPTVTTTPTDEETDGQGDGDDDTGDGEGVVREYVVKEGDTYVGISEDFFGDPSGGPCISRANDEEQLLAGETISVPDSCDPDKA